MATTTLTCGRCGRETFRLYVRMSMSAAERKRYGKRYWICEDCKRKYRTTTKVEGKNA
jgi:hypothetical protein